MEPVRTRRGSIAALIATGLLLLLAVQPAAAAGTSFGSKLSAGTDPSNSPSKCDHELHGGSGTYACTWIMTQAFNGGSVTAPKTGKVSKVKLISWTSGSLTVFLARKNASGQFKVVRKGPKISYHDGCPNDYCSVQKYSVTPFDVSQGDYLAVKGSNMGPLRCDSGGNRIALFTPPLAVGGGYTTPSGYSGCFLMVQLVYAS
jgi:hypothetical protein